ncbi:transferrin receptor protein 1-like [Hemiscyllium ocellatum]|uniref:transferrin receptor protein 1-like n=1 Tax=Hemiscyllium ocellatum TaxID=170820 RepID=UPI00296672FD|nr:transferrin receptor protein 1-like [Hemiscyllium ocellatum]XP_060690671.1 transferrin receptor protein 1-like [Hemiscyllium ocellatum]
MDRARIAISSLLGFEPKSYTRFSLTRRTDGDGSRVEMKLAENENDEEMGDAMADGMETQIEKPHNNHKTRCYLMIAVLLVLIGFLVGYLAFRGQTPGKSVSLSDQPTEASYTDDDDDDGNDEFVATNEEEMSLAFSDIKKMLTDNLDSSQFLHDINKVSDTSNHETGSVGDLTITQYIRQEFLKNFEKHSVWTDTHYVTLQFNSASPNRVWIVGGENPGEIQLGQQNPKVFCPYSATGKFTGKLVYANYGTKDDFKLLSSMSVPVNGSVVVVRAGKINFAEKVTNAENMKAGGVLIYPDPEDYILDPDVAMFGHVHMGLGDPRSPGFPSFNHTQFPPTKSSGLPGILVHSISANAATSLLNKLGGETSPSSWKSKATKIGPGFANDDERVMMEVNNVEEVRGMHNVFAVVKGFEEPDHYVVIGAQRDAFGPGAAESGVGTALLLELSRVFTRMVEDGFRPRRSIIFASWSGGSFGAIGATEWLEGYMSVLHLKVCAYFSLDRAVLGGTNFEMFGSSMLYNLIRETISMVKSPFSPDKSIYEMAEAGAGDWLKAVLQPIPMDTSVYAFLAIGGIPAMGLSFTKDKNYPYNTKEDTVNTLNRFTNDNLNAVTRAMAEVVGVAVIKLIHHHQLPLDYHKYASDLSGYIIDIQRYASELQERGLTMRWLFSARGDFYRAANTLRSQIESSDMNDVLLCRTYNNRIMRVEYNFLSPYVSINNCPYRHLLYGKGNHTLAGIVEQLELLRVNPELVDFNMTRNDLAYATWTVQGAANALGGEVWTSSNNF